MRVRIVATSGALFAWILSTAACGGGAKVTSVAITSPSQTAYTNDAIDITVETRGGSGAVKLYVDGVFLAKAPGGEYTWDTTAVPEGPHSLHATFSGSRSDPVQVVVDRTAPLIVTRYPSHGDDNASTSGIIGAIFNEPMDPVSGVAASLVLELDGVAVTGTVTTTGNTVAFIPSASLPAPADATVRLSPSSAPLTDLAGNALASEDWSFFFPGWEQLSNQLDTVPTNGAYLPNPAVDSLGRIVVTWVEFDSASATATYLAYARRWDGTAWEALGGAFNTDTDRSVFVTTTAVDGQDRPLAAFYEEELPGVGVANVYVRRWNGTAWETLGNGPLDLVAASNTRQIAIAVGADGEPRVSFLENNGVDVRMHVLRWTGVAWTEYGTGFLTSSFWAPNALALDASDNPVVAWRDIANDLRVSRWDGTGFVAVGGVLDVLGTQIPDGPSVVVGSSGAIIVGWNETDPTYGSGVNAYVARFDAVSSTFVRLGDALDMDIALDAYYPDLAVAPDGTLAVTWGEYSDDDNAGYVARWTGTRWQPLGPGLGTGSGANYPQLVMDANSRPVVGWNTFSYPDFLVADASVSRFNSDIVPSGLRHLAPNDGSCSVPSAAVPATLTATGCFFGFPPEAPDPSLVPYELNSALWSDSAEKRRWFLLPEGGTIDVTQTGAWTWPIGTMFFKEFAYDRIKGDPKTRFPIETRIIVLRDAVTVEGYSYKWRDDGSNADLQPNTPSIETYDLIDNGVLVVDTHTFPSQTQCLQCHLANAGFILGPITANLNRNADYGGTFDNQMRAMQDAGLFTADVGDAGALDRFPRPKDPARPLLDRVKSYAAANCAHCHRVGGLAALANFVYETPLAAMNICDDVIVGDSTNSFFYQRINASFGQTVPASPMPPLARRRVDPTSEQLISDWIDGLAACP